MSRKDFYGFVSKRCIDETMLETIMADFFSPKGSIKKQKINDVYVEYEGITEENKVIIYFSSEEKPPFNVYDASIGNGIIDREFEYTQEIIAAIDKQSATLDVCKRVIDFFIYLKSKIESDMLIASELHNEICLLKDQEIIWAKTFPKDEYV